jgi:hypothetical protein
MADVDSVLSRPFREHHRWGLLFNRLPSARRRGLSCAASERSQAVVFFINISFRLSLLISLGSLSRELLRLPHYICPAISQNTLPNLPIVQFIIHNGIRRTNLHAHQHGRDLPSRCSFPLLLPLLYLPRYPCHDNHLPEPQPFDPQSPFLNHDPHHQHLY